MKYIRRFKVSSDYEAFKNSSEWITPNIVYVNENSNLHLQPYVELPYLTIVALEDGLTVSLSDNACEYCIGGNGDWVTLAAGTATPSINTGQKILFKGNLTPRAFSGIGTFTINKKCNLEGNCMSMLFGDNAANNYSLSGKDYAFSGLFSGGTTIVNVSPNFLPATTLAISCYNYMFENCRSLTTAPELPATTLANSCYYYMFDYCTSLTTAPGLPATTLADFCYVGMFNGCSNLNHIKMLATDISALGCLGNWVSDVASSGTFVKNANMNDLPSGTSGIPEGWTVVNDGEESGGLIENNISLIPGLNTYAQSEYPVESDIAVELKGGGDTNTLTIVNGNSKSTQGAEPPSYGQWEINSVTPSEDEVYKYTF